MLSAVGQIYGTRAGNYNAQGVVWGEETLLEDCTVARLLIGHWTSWCDWPEPLPVPKVVRIRTANPEPSEASECSAMHL